MTGTAGTTGTEPPFKSVGIVGLGLIGGSIAHGVRRTWPHIPVIGVDRPDVLAVALSNDVITSARERIGQLHETDLVVLAVPVPDIIGFIKDAGAAGLETLVTDVGSTKRQIAAAAKAAGLRFVGGHPMAGAAHTGLAHASPELLRGRPWLLVPGEAQEADIHRLEQMVRGLGAIPRRLPAEMHDRVMAYVSHAPQLLATTLMSTVGHAVGIEGLSAAGPGFTDMTRLASSPAEIWRGILASNSDYVAEALQALVAALPADPSRLADAQVVEHLFASAHHWVVRAGS